MNHAAKITAVAILITSLSGCLTQRTVTQHGRTVSQKTVVTRPLKQALQE